ncbi:MAG: NfeD family protein [Planctomycetota bacterium]|jgi:membrane-bound serine protease (ClpP class)
MKRHVSVILAVALSLTLSAWAQAQQDNPQPDMPAGAIVRPDGWYAPRQPIHPPPKLPDEVTAAFLIPIKGGIRPALVEAVKRKIAFCKGKGAELVVFELDTPGGDSDSMNEICDLIIGELKKAHTVAFVNPDAYSAGAVISLACDQIIMGEASKIGAATPIFVGPGGKLMPMSEEERAKFESAARAQIRTLAEHNGHNKALAESMITMRVEVWTIRNDATGQLQLVNPDKDNWRHNVLDPPDGESKAGASWRYLRRIDGPRELVTLTGLEAVELALADGMAADMDALLKRFNVIDGHIELGDTPLEKLVAFLTTPPVTGLLMMVGLLGLYTEFRTPGVGVPGAVAVLCFAIAFGARYLTGLANWWEIALIVIGVVLLILEVAVIPGFGVAGVAGIVCVLVGLIGIIAINPPGEPPIPQTPLEWSFFYSGLMALCVAFLLAVVGGAFLGRYLPKIPGVNRLVLAPAAEYSETTASPHTPLDHISAGDVGVVEGMCRPVGKVRFGEDLLDAVTEGDMIEAGAEVRVLRRAGNRVVVEKTSET